MLLYLSQFDNDNLSVINLIDKIERSIFVYDYYDLNDEYVMIDDNSCMITSIFSYYESIELKEDLLINKGIDFYNNCLRILRNKRAKRRRLSKSINNIFSKCTYLYFVTYSFSDKDLSYTFRNRRVKVLKFMKSISKCGCLNVDYGSLNDREHYHAVIGCNDKLDFTRFPANIDFEIIVNSNDTDRISTYIAKLTNHAIKHSTKNKRMTKWGVK